MKIGVVDCKTFLENEEHKIRRILGENTDIRLEYRTICGEHGFSFHDRYIVLNFGINKSRVWMMGSSLNSIGKTHSVVQIVETKSLFHSFSFSSILQF